MQALGDLSTQAVQTQLRTSRYGRSLELRESTASTNDDARAAALAGAVDGHTIVADTQTQGRGARGRSWSSPGGLDLYLSIVARVPVPLEHLPPLTLAVGLAVADTLDGFLPGAVGGATSSFAPPLEGVRARVKWPNDVWVARKKCAGVLLESASQGERNLPVVVGIGLNVNRREFPEGLDTEPTSLALARAATADRSTVLAALLGHVESWVDRFVALGAAPIVAALEARLELRGERARCDELEGTVLGVAPSGALRMHTAEGPVEVLSGTLRPLPSALA